MSAVKKGGSHQSKLAYPYLAGLAAPEQRRLGMCPASRRFGFELHPSTLSFRVAR